eukprot:3393560-Prymnesium_polylepis.1
MMWFLRQPLLHLLLELAAIVVVPRRVGRVYRAGRACGGGTCARRPWSRGEAALVELVAS